MAEKDLIASLDVGTASTRCVIAKRDYYNGKLDVVGFCSFPSLGVRRGMIVDVEACSAAIREAFSFAERMAGARAKTVYIGLSPLHASLQESRSVVAILGDSNEVTLDDVQRVTEAAKEVELPPNREVLDVLTREYIIDGYGGLSEPIGMVGMRLELEASLVVGNLTAVSNLQRATERAGYEVAGFVLKPLALGELLLTSEERELGVALIDIGASVSEIGYFADGSLRQMGVVPLGGAHITNDLVLGLKTSTAVAEKLKTESVLFGAGEKEDRAEAAIDLSIFGHIESKKVYLHNVTDIAEARLEEIFRLILQELVTLTGKNQGVPAGLVLTGGVASTKGIGGAIKRYLPGKTKLAVGAHVSVDDPAFNTAVGILSYILSRSINNPEEGLSPKSNSGGIVSRFTGWLRDFWE